jgi:hypothetical protein
MATSTIIIILVFLIIEVIGYSYCKSFVNHIKEITNHNADTLSVMSNDLLDRMNDLEKDVVTLHEELKLHREDETKHKKKPGRKPKTK